jgi:O-6-methylguanine DNA methyltransferase
MREFDPRGSAVQQRVWQALREIPAGSRASYTEIAEYIGSPKEAYAVGEACSSNMIAVAIPCHRVVRKDGSLAGYRWRFKRMSDHTVSTGWSEDGAIIGCGHLSYPGSLMLYSPSRLSNARLRDFSNYPAYIDGVTESFIEDDKRGDEVGAARRFLYGGNWTRQRLGDHSDSQRSLT